MGAGEGEGEKDHATQPLSLSLSLSFDGKICLQVEMDGRRWMPVVVMIDLGRADLASSSGLRLLSCFRIVWMRDGPPFFRRVDASRVNVLSLRTSFFFDGC